MMRSYLRVVGNDSNLEELLNRGYSETYGHCIEVGPEKVILPGLYEHYHEVIKDFEVRNEDVFILSFPNAGFRWTQEIVWLLLNNLHLDKSCRVPLEERSPLLESEAFSGKLPLRSNFLRALGEQQNPRCIVSHLNWSLLPSSIRTGDKKPKIIVVLQGPEDTCTSYYNQQTAIGSYQGTFAEFCELFLGGKVLLGPYWPHVLSLWDQRARQNIMYVRYNKMKANVGETIRDVSSFLNISLSKNDLDFLCDHFAFDKLHKFAWFNDLL